LIHDANGILFYRGLALDRSADNLGKKASKEHVKKVLNVFKVDRIAIGHTLVENISHDYDGKVIRVDVHHSGEVSEGLFIEDNILWRANNQGNKFALKQVKNSYE
jgi:hypothetical protein